MSRTLQALREEGVGAFGTARARTGWPPEEIKGIVDNRFNALDLQLVSFFQIVLETI